MGKAALSIGDTDEVSHNLLGQRLGRKGRVTRERILAAADRLLADPVHPPLTMSAVAREASLAMTTLYLYFSDFTELLLALLEPIVASAEESYVSQLRERWPDDELGRRCVGFVDAFHAFWQRHARVLHLRNSYAAGDTRLIEHRIHSATPAINLLIAQMNGDPSKRGTVLTGMASALLTGIERLVTITTDTEWPDSYNTRPIVPSLLLGQARLLELGIRDGRAGLPGATSTH